MLILGNKLASAQEFGEQQSKLLNQARRAGHGMGGRSQSQGSSDQLNQEMGQWKQRCSDQHNIIKELVNKMADYGIEITEEELMDMQHQGAD